MIKMNIQQQTLHVTSARFVHGLREKGGCQSKKGTQIWTQIWTQMKSGH